MYRHLVVTIEFYLFDSYIGVEIEGKDYGTLPCTLEVTG